MIKKEEKFFVLKQEDIQAAGVQSRIEDVCRFINETRKRQGKKPLEDNRYILCNQDEPYAEKVWQTILEGERAKETGSKEKVR